MDHGHYETASPMLIAYCLVAASGFIIGALAGWVLFSL